MGEQQLAYSDWSYKGRFQQSEVQYVLCSFQWNCFRTVPFAEYAEMTHCTSTTSRNSSCRLWKKGVLRACYLNKMVPPPLPFHTAVQAGILGSKASKQIVWQTRHYHLATPISWPHIILFILLWAQEESDFCCTIVNHFAVTFLEETSCCGYIYPRQAYRHMDWKWIQIILRGG